MRKRALKREVKHAEKAIFENDADFFNKITAHYQKNENKKKPKSIKLILVPIASSLAAVLIIVLGLVFFFLDDQPTKLYLQENERIILSDLIEVNSTSQEISINFDVSYIIRISRIYDSESADTLYYKLEVENTYTLEKIVIYVYSNPDYKHEKKLTDIFKTITNTNGFSIDYDEIIIQDDIIYSYKYTAMTTHENITMYIEYEQISLDETSNFFNFLESTIKKK